MQTLQPFTLLAGRMMMAAIFVISGVSKITGYTGTQAYMDSVGVPGMLLPLVIALEIGAGLALIIGWQTRIAAFLLAGFSVVAALLFHLNFADQMQSILFMKNIAMAGGLLFIFVHGAGAWSLEARSGSATE